MILQKMRNGAGAGIMKIVLLGFLVGAVAGLVLMDVQGFFRGGLSTDVVAKGGGVRIGTQEFDRTVRRVLASQGMTAQDAYRLGLIDQILQSEIQARLLTKEAGDLGLTISDEVVRGQIAKLAEPLAQGGMSKSDALKRILQSQGISEGEFVNSVRQEMAIGLLRNALVSGAGAVSDDLARALYQSEKEIRAIEAVVFTPSSVQGMEQPSDESLEAYYEANRMDYAIPETRTATLAFLTQENLKDAVEITDEQLKAAYEENIAAYEKPAQREIEQAVFSDQAQAEAALKATTDGKTLKQAVRDATGKDDAYLGKGEFQESGLLPEIAAPVFAGKQGDVVGPVQTALGWHVLVIGKDVAADTVPFENVKNSLKKELAQVQLMDALLAAANEIDDRLAGGEDLSAIAGEYGLTTQKFESFRQSGFSSAGKNLFETFGNDAGQIIDSVFAAEEGEITPLMELSDGRFIAAKVENVTPIAYKAFDDVKTALKEKWMAEQRALLNRARAQDALKKAQQGTSLKEIAAAEKSSVQTFDKVSRADAGTKSITPVALSRIFSVDQGETLLAENDNDIVLVKVTKVTLPETAKAGKEDIEAIKQRVARENAQEMLMQYVTHHSLNSTVKINQALLANLYGGEPG